MPEAVISAATEDLCIYPENRTEQEDSVIEKELEKNLLLLPAWCREKLSEEEWSLVYTEECIEDLFENAAGAGAATDTEKKVIFIERGSLHLMMHEIVHACFYDADSGSNKVIKYEGIEEEMKESGLDPYYTSSYGEYITECTASYLKGSLNQEALPLTTMTVEEMLAGDTWMNN